MADRMVGPRGTVDSCFRVAFCLFRSKLCMSCKTSRNFGKKLENSFAYSDSFMNMNSSSGKAVNKNHESLPHQILQDRRWRRTCGGDP